MLTLAAPALAHAHLAAGLLGAADRPDHPQGLRPRRRRVRSRRQRPGDVRRAGRPARRRRRRPRSPQKVAARDDIADGLAGVRVRRRRAADLRGRAGLRSHRRAAPPAWSTTCAPRRRPGSRSPAPRRCSPTSPTCSPRACGSWSGSSSAVSMLLLGMVFRSVVVPVKAAVMNLLSIGAAFGVMTAIFQWGWGAEPARPRPRDAGVELDADPAVRRAVRPVDGLRGVPALADP